MGGVLRIAHCGGLHVPLLNRLVDAINLVARLMRSPIRWDTETVGCVPSLSSIPAMEQRLLTDALQVRRDGRQELYLLPRTRAQQPALSRLIAGTGAHGMAATSSSTACLPHSRSILPVLDAAAGDT